MRTGLCTDARFRRHVAPMGHPERPARLDAIDRALAGAGLAARCVAVAARPATRAELERAHTPAYLDSLEQTLAARGSGMLDPDTYFSPGSWEAALLAAGAAVELVTRVADGALDDAAGFVRPPGHHALADRAMGFCLINNVAVAAAALRARGQRVAIVDWDVHHGNGTEAIFWDDPDVLYVSTHQYPFYPGSGAAADLGGARGRGATVNVPLPAGSGAGAYLAAFERVVLPSLGRFRPDALLVSAGFDAHRADPLASMALEADTYGRLTALLLGACPRLTVLLEGGYDLDALGQSAAATVAALLGDPPAAAPVDPPTAEERAAVEDAARKHQLP